MAYIGKTNWQNNEIVEASDMNRIEQGITDNDVALQNKVDKEAGKGLSEANFTAAEKLKLSGLFNYDDTAIRALLTGHLNSNLPHLFTDGDTTYRWGLSVENGVVMFNYEEVV